MTILTIPNFLDPRRVITDEEHFRRWDQARTTVVQQAYDAMQKAISWRPFHVGSAVYAWRPYIEAEDGHLAEDPADYLGVRWKIFTGANVKPEKDIPPTCAERFAANSARMAGYTRIIGIVVIGEPQADTQSGLVHNTLHPCGICRRVLSSFPEIRTDTRILTGGLVRDEGGERINLEEFTFAELLNIHAAEK